MPQLRKATILQPETLGRCGEHKGVNNRILLALGWIQSGSKRATPRTSECKLAATNDLLRLYHDLCSLQRDGRRFIQRVFHSKDEVWVDRCTSIIATGT
ncbi:hypothetical protein CMUS01_16284 [Colletotrichum musicola]|uniref:Uncharacterized protein n=1 Tax=Colletotrichum musicola TaxID=2175873 RepID=A0A8H6IQ02_9PEZI|nr:hypothetical protein CMUS01_16284 [Colletotrichum musicola]